MARRHAVFIIGIIAFGALFVVSFLIIGGVEAASLHAAPAIGHGQEVFESNPVAPVHAEAMFNIAAQTTLTCTYTTTTPVSIVTDNFTFNTAKDLLPPLDPLTLLPSNMPAFPTSPITISVETQYFRLNALAGFHYLVDAIPNSLSTYNLQIVVYNSGQTAVLTSTKPLNILSASVDFIPTAAGLYYFAISHIASSCPTGTYRVTADGPATSTPTATGSPTISPTPSPTVNVTALPGADRFEPNFNFDSATTIGLGEDYANLNFVPWAGADPNSRDDDWFRVWVKPGFLVTCETFDLSAQADTNIVLFDNNRNGLGGNDDVDRANGNLGSRISYYATYEGYLYVDIGQLFAVRPNEASLYTYSMHCFLGTGPTATPSDTSPPVTPRPTNTPTIPTDTPIPTPTWTPTPTPPFIQVRPLPTATPLGQTMYTIPILLTVYYDRNDNRTPDPGEGVAGISARVLDVTSGVELQHAFTDPFGFASLTVNAPGVVRFVVPYLNHSVVVQPSGYSVALRIPPYDIPNVIP